MASAVHAEETYYLTVFASEGNPKRPSTCHVFAVFTKIESKTPSAKDAKVTNQTISWLPATGVVNPLGGAEPGKNFDLESTLRWAGNLKSRVLAWGPYEIKPELYEFAQKQKEGLDGGKIAYVMLDGNAIGRGATNCIHAVSDAIRVHLATGIAFGAEAPPLILRHFGQFLRQPAQAQRWAAQHVSEDPSIEWVALPKQ